MIINNCFENIFFIGSDKIEDRGYFPEIFRKSCNVKCSVVVFSLYMDDVIHHKC